jgi:hypothetical protein
MELLEPCCCPLERVRTGIGIVVKAAGEEFTLGYRVCDQDKLHSPSARQFRQSSRSDNSRLEANRTALGFRPGKNYRNVQERHHNAK